MKLFAIAVAALALVATPAVAEVTQANSGAFLIRGEQTVAASPAEAWRALGRIERWWNSSHTYSGDARRLDLDVRAGGCWCERWDGGSVEHGRVVLVMDHAGTRTLRIDGAFGPLQEMGAAGVLTFTISPNASGANIVMTYRVSGEPGLGLDQIAPLVDGVMTEQFGRLVRYTQTGTPD